ncbi:MAG: hypothetical protein HY901_24770 [Deltaproteobacteria bacterium]|nr:hypothetical protein [Deltaproteobacteria bacterium]
MVVLPRGLEVADFYRLNFNDAVLPEAQADEIRRSPLAQHIRLVEPRLYGNVSIKGQDLVLVGTPDAPPAPEGMPTPVVIGAAAAKRLDARPGELLTANGVELRIARVDEAPPEGLDLALFVPLARAQQILDRPGGINALRLGGCWCSIDVPTLARQVEQQLPGTRALTVAGMLAAQKGSVATMKRYSSALLAVGLGLVAGIIATLIASQVRRQIREVGLLLAVGLTPVHAVLLFTIRAALVAGLGAAIGLVLAGPATNLLAAMLLGLPLASPRGMAAPVIGLCILVACVVAASLALRAARLDPSAVLREP